MFKLLVTAFALLTTTLYAASSINIINTDISQYPYVNMTYTSTDSHGLPNIKVFHDGSQQLPIKSFSKGASNSINNIVLVMDVSGSMGYDRTLYPEKVSMGYAQRAAINFVNGLPKDAAGKLTNSNVSVIVFNTYVTKKIIKSTNIAQIEKTITDLSADGGTYTYTGTQAGINELAGSQGNKILMVFSDGSTSDSSKEQATIDLAKKYGIAINSIALGKGANINDLKPMAVATGGAFVADDGSSAANNNALQRAFNNIYASFNSGYTVRVQVPVKTAGSKHTLKVQVQINKALVTMTDSITYQVPYKTKIGFTLDTWKRSGLSQQENIPFKVDALITTDHCSLKYNSVVLYSKNVTSSWTNPSKVIMKAEKPCTSGKVETIKYTANIPASIMKRYGVNYYVSTTDKLGFSTLYPDNPSKNAMAISILPNARPAIAHTVVKTAPKNQALVIKGTVKDNTRKIASIELYYKRPFDISYYRQGKTNVNQTVNNFSFTIPAKLMNDTQMHYFIVATDDFGVQSSMGTSYAPKIVKVSVATPPLPTSKLNWVLQGSGDFNRNGFDELVWYNKTNGQMFTWEPGSSNTSGLKYNKLPTISDLNWVVMAISDLNFDEYPDIILQNKASGAIKIHMMHRYFTTYVRTLPTLSTSMKVVGIADFDGDGLKDIALRDLNTGVNKIWYNLDSSLKTIILPTLKMLDK